VVTAFGQQKKEINNYKRFLDESEQFGKERQKAISFGTAFFISSF